MIMFNLLAYQKPWSSALLVSFLLQTCEHSKGNIFLDIDLQHYSTKPCNECGGGKLPFDPLVRNQEPFSCNSSYILHENFPIVV